MIECSQQFKDSDMFLFILHRGNE